MARALPRKLTVIGKQFISANMLRITLAGDDLASLAAAQEGGYIKLHFARADKLDGDIEQQIQSEDASSRPLLRTYTIRNQRANPAQIDVDFVIHEAGPASTWAGHCSIGSTIYVAGPGKKKIVDLHADWFFIVGDMTALPAIGVNFEQLPSTAKGYAVIEVLTSKDIQHFDLPAALELHWIIKYPQSNTDQQQSSSLLHKVQQCPALLGTASVWIACEFNSMREIRQHFSQHLNIDKRHIYASSYWKLGLSEDEHKQVKMADARTA
ncbi:siderophore-interacting protein [Gammaproteobacteria bacterium AS21]